MKRLHLLSIFFLLSCSDMSEDNEQKTELEKCIAANILLIKDSNLDENNFQGYPKILETPVKFDLNYILLLLDVYEGADSAVWYSIDKIEKMNITDEKERTIAIYEELVNSGYISDSFNIHTDYEKPYFTLYDPEDYDYKREYTLDDLLEEYFNGVSEEDEELLQYIYAFTISTLDNAMLTDLAQKTCWRQGIY